jgi:hypothetical protein
MSGKPPEDKSVRGAAEQRSTGERRTRTLHALLQANWTPRRRGARRKSDTGFAAIDWHDSRWLAVAMLIVILSCVDAFLTVTLLANGAYEANPVMAALLDGSPHAFALAKVGLTSLGVVLLTAVVRARAFGRMPVGVVLYTALLGYATLVAYEYWLCDHHILGP